MKKKLNLFCVLILVLKAAQIIIGNVMSFGENAQAFKEGWEDGGKAETNSGDLLIGILGIACIFLIIRSLIAFVRFILNVNRDKVFVWENVPLLRWTGWGLLTATAIIAIHDLLEHIPVERIYNNSIDDFIFSVFCLIMAEVFIIGLKLKEEQDLTI
jgi:hypothetical protein